MGAALLALGLTSCAGLPQLPAVHPGTAHGRTGVIQPRAATAPGGEVAALQRAVVDVVEDVEPSVVQIQAGGNLGSGLIFDPGGDVVTNAHLIAGAPTVEVTLASGRRYAGRLIGAFAPDDLAVIRIGAGNLRPASFGDSSQLQVGDPTVAVGNPLGPATSVTSGVISALGRTVYENQGRTALPDMIQTSAPVNPGNSGGALADLSGQVVGMPTLGVTDPQLGPDAPGVGFAIPSNTVRDIATQLVERGRVVMSHRADLGVSVENVMGVGALVVSVNPGGPAARAGVQVDQMITSIAGRPTPSAGALAEALSELQPGETVPVVLVRPDESRTTIRVTLGRYPGG